MPSCSWFRKSEMEYTPEIAESAGRNSIENKNPDGSDKFFKLEFWGKKEIRSS